MSPTPIFCCLALGLPLSSLAGATALLRWDEPDPFRREQLAERPYSLTATGLLDRFSFEAQPALAPERRLVGNGLVALAGSTRSRELYVRSQARMEIGLDGLGLAGLRLRRDEDLDGRFEQYLIGLGLGLGDWQVWAWGDVQATKEDIDVHLEGAWRPDTERHLRLRTVLVDPAYNDKQDDGRYRRAPISLMLDGSWRVADWRWYGFGRANLPMLLEMSDSGIRARDAAYAGGLGLAYLPDLAWQAGLELEGLYGRRRQDFLPELLSTEAHANWQADQDDPLPDGLRRFDPGPWPERALDRRYLAATIEARYLQSDGQLAWLGMRALSLREDDRRQAMDDNSLTLRRREYLFYCGWRYPLADDRLRLSPTLFFNRYLGTERERSVDPAGDDSDSHERAWQVKLAPAIDIILDRDRRAVLTLNLSLMLYEPKFGGGNVQLFLPF